MHCLNLATRAGVLHDREAQSAEAAASAGDATELGGGELLAGANRLVDGGENHVLKKLRVLRIDRLRIDGDLEQAQIAAHLDLDHPAAGTRLDDLVLELLLRLHHLGLHLLDLLHHRVQLEPSGPGCSGHLAASSSASRSSASSNSSASNSDLSFAISSSSLSSPSPPITSTAS